MKHVGAIKARAKKKFRDFFPKPSQTSTNTPDQEHSTPSKTSVANVTDIVQSDSTKLAGVSHNGDIGNSGNADIPSGDKLLAGTEHSLFQASIL